MHRHVKSFTLRRHPYHLHYQITSSDKHLQIECNYEKWMEKKIRRELSAERC